MLWRALGHVENGFYIDIGAQHPIIDSVSKAFYEKGWRGISVEANPAYAALLRGDRPDESVIQAAVSDSHGVIVFYELPETGLSTGDAKIAQGHRERGFEVREITVPCITLADVFKQAEQKDIHWLKIDVEGMELQVLLGWGSSKARPWIVVVESTLPLTQTETYSQWEDILLQKGYKPVYFDGLNRYYLSSSQPQLAEAFRAGPNVFDDFTLNGTASAPFCSLVIERHRQQEQALAKELAEANAAIIDKQAKKLENLLRTLASREKESEEQISAARQEFADSENRLREELDNLLRTCAQREKEYGEKLLMTQQSAESEKTELRRIYAEQVKALQQKFAQREDSLRQEQNLHLQTLQQHFADTLAHHQQQHEQSRQTAAAFEEHLKQQLQSEQQAVIQLKQALTVLQVEMDGIRSSFSWWITAPLRKLAGLFETTEPSVACSSPTVIPTPDNLVHIPVETTNQFLEPDHYQIPQESASMTTNTIRKNVTAVETVDDLLACYDEQFVRRAYLTLLGREPDPAGRKYYLGRLRKGYSKESVLVQLAGSEEAQLSGLKLTGLDGVLRKHKSKHKLLALLFPGWFSRQRTQQQLNRLENALGCIAQLLTRLEQESTQRLANLEHAMGALQVSINDMEHNIAGNKAQAKPPAPPAALPKPDTSSLSLPAQRIFANLSQTVENSKKRGTI